ncbi:MAG: ATP-binding protein [Solirubrobacteraceae bacterium]
MGFQRAGGLLERERELALIDRAIARAVEGGGGVILVEGQAGIGKTQLLAASRERAAAAGLDVWSVRGGVLEHGHAYGVTRTLLRPIVARRAAAGEPLPRIAAAAAPLFDPAAPPMPGHPSEPSFPVLTALCELVLAEAQAQPLLVAVDDAHWVDSETLRFLAALARRAQERRCSCCWARASANPAHRGSFWRCWQPTRRRRL